MSQQYQQRFINLGASSSSTEIIVGVGQDFPTINSAIVFVRAQGLPSACIRLTPGFYPENLSDLDGISIRGCGQATLIVGADDTDPIVDVSSVSSFSELADLVVIPQPGSVKNSVLDEGSANPTIRFNNIAILQSPPMPASIILANTNSDAGIFFQDCIILATSAGASNLIEVSDANTPLVEGGQIAADESANTAIDISAGELTINHALVQGEVRTSGAGGLTSRFTRFRSSSPLGAIVHNGSALNLFKAVIRADGGGANWLGGGGSGVNVSGETIIQPGAQGIDTGINGGFPVYSNNANWGSAGLAGIDPSTAPVIPTSVTTYQRYLFTGAAGVASYVLPANTLGKAIFFKLRGLGGGGVVSWTAPAGGLINGAPGAFLSTGDGLYMAFGFDVGTGVNWEIDKIS